MLYLSWVQRQKGLTASHFVNTVRSFCLWGYIFFVWVSECWVCCSEWVGEGEWIDWTDLLRKVREWKRHARWGERDIDLWILTFSDSMLLLSNSCVSVESWHLLTFMFYKSVNKAVDSVIPRDMENMILCTKNSYILLVLSYWIWKPVWKMWEIVWKRCRKLCWKLCGIWGKNCGENCGKPENCQNCVENCLENCVQNCLKSCLENCLENCVEN